MNGALSGLRVLDFSSLVPGPMATLFLAEAGAEIIKVERPDRGDEMRSYTPKFGEDSANFAILNRGKKSIALDLKDPDNSARLIPLLSKTDVLVEQFRPGVMDRLGLGYEAVARHKPDIIYCSITGYGQSGPQHNRAGHDLNYIGDVGLLALNPGTADAPVIPPALIADIAGGAYPAIVNILLALRRRDQTGRGTHLDISMADNLFPFLYWALAEGQASGKWPGSGDALVTGGSPRYRLYPTSDGRFVAVGAIEEKFWTGFCNAIGLGEPLRDDTFDPPATTAAVATIIASKGADYWTALFEVADCCCTVVNTLAEALENPHFRARGLFDAEVLNTAGERMTALPVPIAPAFRARSIDSIEYPALGSANEELLHEG